MKIRPHIVGHRFFDDRPVTATDPGYDKNVWCILKGIKVKPGNYTCVAWKGREVWTTEGKRHSCTHIMVCGIYLDGHIPSAGEWNDMENIGQIGVDTGLAGFFQDKPNYNCDEWLAMCDKLRNKSWMIAEEGFFTNSGYGDGSYNVYGIKNAEGLFTALEIRF